MLYLHLLFAHQKERDDAIGNFSVNLECLALVIPIVTKITKNNDDVTLKFFREIDTVWKNEKFTATQIFSVKSIHSCEKIVAVKFRYFHRPQCD